MYDSGFAISAGTNMVSCEGPLVRSHSPQTTMEKPLPSLPSLPSPTLTNPDMVLPSAGSMKIPESPESLRGPPSISYLRDITNQHAGARATMERDRPSPPKKEKRGLMSRKLMLLRSRTASDRQDSTGRQDNTGRQDFPVRTDSLEDTSTIPSSPTIYSSDHLAPQSVGKRSSISGSSLNSDDYGALPAFLSRHRSREDTESEDTDTEKPAGMRMGYSVSIAGGSDVQRRTREEEEQNSAMLSQRAEQILANAKKRLNLMEGNLRGARDLVTPLTAANLKRATSLGSSAALQPAANYGNKRFLMDGYTNTRPGASRPLHLQISTPSLRRDYQQSHGRTNSENTLPERPHTALARGDMFGRKGRIPVRPSTSSWTDLRGSPGYDSVTSPALPHESDGISGRRSATPGVMRTPDTDLEPLPEESASQVAPSVSDIERDSAQYEPDYAYGLGIHRSPSTTDGLKGQMSNLKNRISTLRERAKEDSMRRQSFNNLRDVSPLNNAEYQPPEIWYGSQSDAAVDAEAGADYTPTRKLPAQQPWGSLPLKTGSRNAFAELAAKQQSGNLTLRERRFQATHAPYIAGENGMHEKHMVRGSRDMPGSFNTNDNEIISNFGAEADEYQHSASDAPTLDTPDNPSEYFPDIDAESVYEDAEPDLPSSIVPHEQREDAFDYENFFLHSAMARYQQSSSPPGSDCDTESISSVSTAKGPTATIREIDPSQQDDMVPPATPETPETLRNIERRIAHSRSQSIDSISTSASFATAAEQHGRGSPSPFGGAISKPNSRRSSRAGQFSRPSSTDPSNLPRPSTNTSTIRSTSTTRRTPSDPPSSRRRSTLRRSQGGPIAVSSPVLSSIAVSSPVQDPTAIAVNALLDSQARCLGLKDKALVFGVVESLRKVCGKLQEGDDEEAYDLREWRRRLDSCRKALEGIAEES
jgi:hypothetical protein